MADRAAIEVTARQASALQLLLTELGKLPPDGVLHYIELGVLSDDGHLTPVRVCTATEH